MNPLREYEKSLIDLLCCITKFSRYIEHRYFFLKSFETGMNLGQSVLNRNGDIPKSKNVLPYSRHHVLLSSNLEIMFPEDRNHVQSLENKNHNVSGKKKKLFAEFLPQPFMELGLWGLQVFTGTSFRQGKPLLKV